MPPTNFTAPHYLDACIAVKLVCRESGSECIETYIRQHCSFTFCITEFALYEVLGVLKRKWIKQEIDHHGYVSAIGILEGYLDELIEIDSDFKPHDRRLILSLGEFAKKHNIDYSDALQIYTILNGRWKSCVQECKTVLVTADGGLATAAVAEGLRVWHFPDGTPPDGESGS
jgi:predicted nucleic acid-binding protein